MTSATAPSGPPRAWTRAGTESLRSLFITLPALHQLLAQTLPPLPQIEAAAKAEVELVAHQQRNQREFARLQVDEYSPRVVEYFADLALSRRIAFPANPIT